MKTKSKPKLGIIAAALASTMVLAFISSVILLHLQAYAIPKNGIKGSLTSLQNDESGKPAWIVSGVFRMDNMNSSSPTLNAAFYMIKKDGTSPHTHTISDFKIIGKRLTSGNSTIVNGTSTVTMKDGPVQLVPTSMKLTDDSAVSIWLDPSKTKGHFGNTVIYGTQHLICVEKPQYCK
ncbi:MAG: hypothetical protein WBQ25_25900 [Nitrososphaeraceae archaeon]